jgi:hypothetical protein
MTGMDDHDIDVRNVIYRLFVYLRRAPAVEEVSEAAGMTVETTREVWHRLALAHAIVLDSDGSLLMANPFSAIPTPYRVEEAGRWWYANCAWDAFGICAALHVDGRIETTCPDCGDAIVVEVRDRRADDESLLFHCLVPAARWWDDIVFT